MHWTKLGFDEAKGTLLTPDQASLVADRHLGRRVNSKKRAYKSYGSLSGPGNRFISTNLFMPPNDPLSDVRALSVDCMGVVPDSQIAQIAIRQLKKRKPPKDFFGWYVLTVGDAYDIGCTLRISPTPENRYHADIVLPVDPTSKLYRDDLMRIVNNLAARASFVSYGNWIDDVNVGQQ